MKLFFLLLFLSSSLLSSDYDSIITFLPHAKFFSPITASGTEHRISYSKEFGNGNFIGSMGGMFPVADVRLFGWLCQTSVASSINTVLKNQGVRFDVNNIDFYVEMMFDIPLNNQSTVRFGWGHTSHHLVDDAVLSGRIPINYAREYYRAFLQQKINIINGLMYGGSDYSYSTLINGRIDGQWLFEFGGEGGNISIIGPVKTYAAFDIKFRSEVGYGSTQSYQAGIKTQDGGFRAIRVAYTYRTGIEDRGQYYNARRTIYSIGMYFDF